MMTNDELRLMVAFLITIAIIFGIVMIITTYLTLKTHLLHRTQKKALRLAKAELHENNVQLAKNQEINGILYKLLNDLIDTHDSIILQYKITNLRAIMTILSYHDSANLSENTLHTLIDQIDSDWITHKLRDVMTTNEGIEYVEEDTRSAYEKFNEIITQLEEEQKKAETECDDSLNSYSSDIVVVHKFVRDRVISDIADAVHEVNAVNVTKTERD